MPTSNRNAAPSARRRRPHFRNVVEQLENRTLLAGDGLLATYFNNAAIGGGGQQDFTGPSVTRVEPNMNLNWNGGSPDASIGADTFTARFAGRVEAPVSGTYTFGVSGDNGTRLWVDDRLIVDHWTDTYGYTDTGTTTLALEAGRKYHIVLEYFENVGGANVNLQWDTPTTPGLVTIPTANLHSDNRVYPAQSVVNVKSAYGAVGDGIADDWWPIQRAISDRLDGSTTLYLPAGTYKVSKPLIWRKHNADRTPVTTGFSAGWGAWLSLQGQGRDNTVIRLADNTFTANPGYGTPNAVIFTASRDDQNKYDDVLGAGNQAFGNNLFDLSVDVGSGNGGAVGIDYIASNYGAIDNVLVQSRSGSGYSGIRFVRRDAGPALFQDVAVRGFSYGIEISTAGGLTSLTAENIRLRGQGVTGLYTNGAMVQVKGLDSVNSVPAVTSYDGYGHLVLIDAKLTGGSAGNTAVYADSYLLARNVTSTGYGTTLRNNKDGANQNFTGPVGEFVTYGVLNGFADSIDATLNLTAPETPEFFERDVAKWRHVDPGSGNDQVALQNALNDTTKTTISLSPARYYLTGTLTVPGHVRNIIGNGATFNVASGHAFGDAGNPIPVFRFTGGAAGDLVVLERIRNEISTAGAISVIHDSPRTLVLKNAAITSRQGYDAVVTTANAGDTFVEDITGGVRLASGKRAYARQLNSETPGYSSNTNNGGQLWILGVKTEGGSQVINTINGGTTEVLGGLLYPKTMADRPAFLSVDSRVSLSFVTASYYQNPNAPYNYEDFPVLVRNTRGGVTVDTTRSMAPGHGIGRAIPLYTAYAPIGSGTIRREVWSGVTGSSVSNIPLATAPSSAGLIGSLEGPTNVADNYGTRIRGYVHPPITGSYTFWVAGDDNTELYLSTSDDRAARTRIASVVGATLSREWGKYGTQKSVAVSLTAGKKYYVEVLHKEGIGGDNVAVGWAKPGQPTTTPSEVIPGSLLSPFIPVGTSGQLNDAGFESPSLGSGSGAYVYRPAGTAWTYTGNAGVQANGSAWGGANAPQGVQTAFLQGNGSIGAISQSLALSAGTYVVRFQAARRAYGDGAQPVRVLIDGVQVGATYTPGSTAFGLITTATFNISVAGSYTLRLEASDATGDRTTFIDDVRLAAV